MVTIEEVQSGLVACPFCGATPTVRLHDSSWLFLSIKCLNPLCDVKPEYRSGTFVLIERGELPGNLHQWGDKWNRRFGVKPEAASASFSKDDLKRWLDVCEHLMESPHVKAHGEFRKMFSQLNSAFLNIGD